MGTTTAELITVGLVGLGCGLSKDIVFSWLKGGRGETGDKCSEHQEALGRIDERVTACETALAKGDARFSRVEKILENMAENVAVLLDRSDRRREGEHHGA